MSNPTDSDPHATATQPGAASPPGEAPAQVEAAEADLILAARPAKIPDIESIHRDLAFANVYRQEFIKSLILIAGALFAFSVSFRPELRAVAHEGLFWIAWIGLGVSMLGGFTQLAAWERFYSSFQRFEWKKRDGKVYRDRIALVRRIGLLVQVAGFVLGVATLGSFTAVNLGNFEKTKATTGLTAPPAHL